MSNFFSIYHASNLEFKIITTITKTWYLKCTCSVIEECAKNAVALVSELITFACGTSAVLTVFEC